MFPRLSSRTSRLPTADPPVRFPNGAVVERADPSTNCIRSGAESNGAPRRRRSRRRSAPRSTTCAGLRWGSAPRPNPAPPRPWSHLALGGSHADPERGPAWTGGRVQHLETCPVSTGRRTRRIQLVREKDETCPLCTGRGGEACSGVDRRGERGSAAAGGVTRAGGGCR